MKKMYLALVCLLFLYACGEEVLLFEWMDVKAKAYNCSTQQEVGSNGNVKREEFGIAVDLEVVSAGSSVKTSRRTSTQREFINDLVSSVSVRSNQRFLLLNNKTKKYDTLNAGSELNAAFTAGMRPELTAQDSVIGFIRKAVDRQIVVQNRFYLRLTDKGRPAGTQAQIFTVTLRTRQQKTFTAGTGAVVLEK